MSPKQNQKTGVIFPIRPKHVKPIFDYPNDVFLKFTKLKIENGMKIIFYVSYEKMLLGIGNVNKFERMKPESAWKTYNDRIFLDEKEFMEYTKISPINGKSRRMKEIGVMVLSNVKRFPNPISLTENPYPMNPSGRYCSRSEYDKLIQKAKLNEKKR